MRHFWPELNACPAHFRATTPSNKRERKNRESGKDKSGQLENSFEQKIKTNAPQRNPSALDQQLFPIELSVTAEQHV